MTDSNLHKKDEPEIHQKHTVPNGALLHTEAAINLIPVAGGFLATYFGKIRDKRAQQRMLRFIEYFSDKIKEFDENKLDKEYLNSEEFAELFAQGVEESARSTTEKRIKRFANILINNSILGAEARSRTQSIMSFVDRISDLDAFVILCFGNPNVPSLRAETKTHAYSLVQKLSSFLGIECSRKESIIESIIYMDNLGLTWVNENRLDKNDEKGKDLILKEFSSFRTPLGDAVTAVIAPPSFYKTELNVEDAQWPEDHVANHFRGLGSQ